MNKALYKFHYQICTATFDEMELKFREVFGLARFCGQPQHKKIVAKNQQGENCTICISQEFYDRLAFLSNWNPYLLNNGYLVYLKKSVVIPGAINGDVNDKMLATEMASTTKFIQHLENVLHLNRKGTVYIDKPFAYFALEGKVVCTNVCFSATHSMKKPYEFAEKDNYALKIWLGLEDKIATFVQLAMESFAISFKINNGWLRYLQLLNTLDLCFIKMTEKSVDALSQYCAVLLARDKFQYAMLSDEIKGFYQLKSQISRLDLQAQQTRIDAEMQLNNQTERLEELTREILKKLIKNNPKKTYLQNDIQKMDNGPL
ncbi:MAG: hypothetical protein JST58_06500 [Bacteroidetes bacterium]|nr:hypothetical protein [Bacteroidota bacterium]